MKMMNWEGVGGIVQKEGEGVFRRTKLNFGIQLVDIVIGVSLLLCSMLVFEWIPVSSGSDKSRRSR